MKVVKPFMNTKEIKLPLKYLTIAMAAIIVVPTTQADTGNKKIGDLEIFAMPTAGQPNVMMMLDISGSMNDAITGCIRGSGTTKSKTYTYTDTTNSSNSFSINSTLRECEAKNADGTTYTKYNRVSTLKNALLGMLTDNTVNNDIGLGIGVFSYNGNGTTGIIRYPVQKLTSANRKAMATYIANLSASGGTPTPSAYAEAGAFMLGTKTSGTGSGFTNSDVGTKKADKLSYLQGAQATTCSGNGIYLLTDGEPNTSINATQAQALMNTSLDTNSTKVTQCNLLPNGTQGALGWGCMANYAQILQSSTNVTGLPIKTATVGFGSDMAGLSAPTVINGKKVYNCLSATDKDVQNLCRLGQEFGGGGYYYATTSEDVTNSLSAFMDELSGAISPVPSGTIVIPDDPYRADSQLAVAFYPTLQAEVDKSPAVWRGNMKKYSLDEGTLYGKNSVRLFQDATVSGNLNPDAEDLWSAANDTTGNNKVTAGGMYSNLKTPTTAVDGTRTVYVEDSTSATDSKPVLRKFSVNASGKVLLDGNAYSDTNKFRDTTVFTEPTTTSEGSIRKLIKFLGFDNLPADTTDTKSLVLTNPANAVKVLGASIHATPAAVSYSATLDTDGRVTDTRDDYMLFGSSDGALHLVNSDNYGTGDGGKEQFAIIPKIIVKNQPKALEAGGISDKGKGNPYFGIDAPWLVDGKYFYDTDNSRVTVSPCPQDTALDPTDSRECRNTGVYAYGGLRMGGEALYGMNLTDKSNPNLMFTITPATSGFDRMGQIWSKPTKAKIATAYDSATKKYTSTDVLIFGGGYDMKYEADSYVPSSTDLPKGNAVYMINAKTGALIWSATNVAPTSSPTGATNKVNANLTHSIVGGVTALDRNNDGFMDHIYFADLGGQVFRADFTNAGDTTYTVNNATSTPTVQTGFANQRVTRILAAPYSGANAKYNYRFYERPVVSFYRNSLNNRLFALVNVISGDRSSPLSKMRSDNTYADRLYGIMDSDITLPNSTLYNSSFTPELQNIADTNLLALPSSIGSTSPFTAAAKQAQVNILVAGTKADNTKIYGWYYPLTRFDGFSGVKYNKGIGKSEVINSYLFTSVYNPDMQYSKTEDCTAKITGGTERELYCLPYGICMDDTSKSGTGGFSRAGQGIQELTLGPRSSTLTNQKLLIGTRTLDERASDIRVDYNDDSSKMLAGDTGNTTKVGLNQSGVVKAGGDGTAAEFIFNERYTLTPTTWYEVNK